MNFNVMKKINLILVVLFAILTFTSADALSGSLTAKYYLKHKTLQGWQVDRWTKLNKRGDMRIAKYWAQLARAAEEKAAIKAAV